MKKKYSLFGNCQTHALKWLLRQSNEFRDTYEEVEALPSYEMTPEKAEAFCRDVIPQIDVLIAQPHSARMSRWHQHDELRARCDEHGVRAIFIPQIYFSAYNPWERDIPGLSGSCTDDRIIYTDCFLASNVLDGVEIAEFLNKIEILSEKRSGYIDRELNHCLRYQENVENQRMCDVKILDRIKAHMVEERLMRNNNHPGGFLMKAVADDVLRLLSIDFSTNRAEMFKNHESLIYPFVAKHFGFAFQSERAEIEERFDYYQKHFLQLAPAEYSRVTELLGPYRWSD